MVSIGTEIDELIKANKLHRYMAELANTNDQERKEILHEIITEMNKTSSEKSENKAQQQINNMHKNIDLAQMQKPWGKMPDYYKELKIKEYASDNSELLEKLLKAFEEGKLKTAKKVNYDNVNCKIISIPSFDK
jgi:hypothetical protein